MNLADTLFPLFIHVLAALAALSSLVWALRGADWKSLAVEGRIHAMLGSAVGLALLWSLQAPVRPGLHLHLLGAMALTLALGPRLTLIVMAMALTGIALNGSLPWMAWPVNFLLMGLWPVCFAEAYRRVAQRYLPAHFFVYIFVVAFLGSGLTVLAAGLMSTGLLLASAAYPAYFLAEEYLPYFILLGFSEAWLSGAMLTLLVVFRPEWVASFDDARYLTSK